MSSNKSSARVVKKSEALTRKETQPPLNGKIHIQLGDEVKAKEEVREHGGSLSAWTPIVTFSQENLMK